MQQKDKQRDENEKHAGNQLNAAIGEQVMHMLGEPGDLQRVQVRKLWDDHYRVNVFVGPNAGSVQIADCFFLLTDGDGTILESSPKITKRYEEALVAAGVGIDN